MKKKIKIYIVDDEKRAINYFKMLIEETHSNYMVIGEATNSTVALSEIMRLKPDIAFIDISMPIINGLVLSERILSVHKFQKIVLLTSHRDFDYVKKGMELGVASYMLKNELTKESLECEVVKIIQQVEIEKKKIHALTEYNLKTFLISEEVGEDCLIYENQPMQRYSLIYIIKDQQIQLDDYSIHKGPINIRGIEDLICIKGLVCRSIMTISETCWCGIYFHESQVNNSEEQLKEVADIIQQFFYNQGVEVSCIISNSTNKFLQLPEIYRQLVVAGGYMFFYGRQLILKQQDIKVQKTDRIDHDLLCVEWIQALDNENYTVVVSKLKKMLQLYGNYYTINAYIEKLKELRGILKRFVERKKLDSNLQQGKEEIRSINDVQDCYMAWVKQIFDVLNKQKEQHYSRKIIQTLDYMHKNYNKNIAIKNVADAVGLSEGYLRKWFKKEVGITIVDYLTHYRIIKAKQLMKIECNKIIDICTKTGFTSSQYFSYVFKKAEGMTPSDYMKKISKSL